MNLSGSSYLDDSLTVDNGKERVNNLFRLIENEAQEWKKLEYMQEMVRCLQSFIVQEEKYSALDNLAALMKQFVENIFDENVTISKNGILEHDLRLLRDNFKNCIEIFKVLNDILDDFVQNGPIEFEYVEFVSKNFVLMLINAFHHCKNSNEYYEKYFEKITEIIELFKCVQIVHTKLLKVLEVDVTYENITVAGADAFIEVLGLLCKICDLLSGMNVKSLVDGWKCYLTIIQRHSDLLKRSEFTAQTALSLIDGEIDLYLDNTLSTDVSDTKTALQHLKVALLLLKVAIKLYDTFENLNNVSEIEIGVKILVTVQKVSPSYLDCKGYSKEVVSFTAQNLVVCADQFLEKLLTHKKFCSVLSNATTLNQLCAQKRIPFLIFATKTLPRISTNDNINAQNTFVFPVFLETIFEMLAKSFVELLRNSNSDGSLYEELLLQISTAVLVFSTCYESVEAILFSNVLRGNDWCALFAIDVWCLSLRCTDSRACYDVLCNVLNKTERIVKVHFFKRPELVHLHVLIYRLYEMLEADHKKAFVYKYPLDKNLHVWKILGLRGFPCRNFVEKFLTRSFDAFQSFANASISLGDFTDLCDAFEVLATIDYGEFGGLKTKQLVSCIFKMWQFDTNNTGLLTSNLFKMFVEKLVKCTASLVLHFSNSELLTVLNQLKRIVHINTVKLSSVQILTGLAAKNLQNCTEKPEIFAAISDLFNSLLKDDNPVVKQLVLDAFIEFTNATPHDEIVEGAIGGSNELQVLVSGFIKKEWRAGSGDEYLAVLAQNVFVHACTEWTGFDMPQRKRFKSNGVGLHLKRIQQEVKSLTGLREELTEENLKDVNDIIVQLQSL